MARKVKQKPSFCPTFKWLLENPIRLLGFGLGAGLSPIAPGTVGTLVALPFAALLLWLGLPIWSLIILSIIAFPIGVKICDICEKHLGVSDYGGIVFDEIAAMWLILGCIPFTTIWWILAFIAFRFFDALKPFPIRWFDNRVHGGFGVMLDDYIAALMCIILFFATNLLLTFL